MNLGKDMPLAFLACGENDRQNISQGLPKLYLAMKKAGASAELHVFANVGHGFGFRATIQGAVAGWPQRFSNGWGSAAAYLSLQPESSRSTGYGLKWRPSDGCSRSRIVIESIAPRLVVIHSQQTSSKPDSSTLSDWRQQIKRRYAD